MDGPAGRWRAGCYGRPDDSKVTASGRRLPGPEHPDRLAFAAPAGPAAPFRGKMSDSQPASRPWTANTPRPTEIKLHQKSRLLEIAFDDGKRYSLPCEYLRVFSPSAEVRGHGPGQEVLQVGQARRRDQGDRAGRRLRREARLLRRPRHRPLLLGIPLRAGREAGIELEELPRAPRAGRTPRATRNERQDHPLRLPGGPRGGEGGPRGRGVQLGRDELRPR